jgi:hypothetical protein
MRLYTFTHFMLSSIQQGIQSGHVSQTLFLKYQHKSTKQFKALYEWAPSPTIIALNGGNSFHLKEILTSLENSATFLKLPYAEFFEDQESMQGVRTSVGVIIPARIYEAAAAMRSKEPSAISDLPILHSAEVDLIILINSHQFAK